MPDSTTAAPVFQVTVAPDELSASLLVAQSLPGDSAVDVATALAYLAEVGITYGVDAEDVERAIAERGEVVLVAQGRAPVDGEDGRFEVEPRLQEIGGRPRVQDDGRVDLFELDLIHTVKEGQVLAWRIPPTPMEPGVTVKGRVLLGRRGRQAPGAAGQGTRMDEDGREIIATLAGHAVVVGDRISVSSIYQIPGDVGVATGHVEFIGSVMVRGDVRPGFRLQAGGDVEIRGNVNGGTVEAGGNISVRYGILGQGHVVAAGTVRAKFVEYADVRAGAEVWVSDGIVQSTVTANTTIEVLGRYGHVVGGHVFARKSVVARELGSARGIRTTIAVGTAPDLLPEARRLAARQEELGKKIPPLGGRLKYFQEQSATGRLNQRGVQEMESSASELRALIDESKLVAARQNEIAALLEDLSVAFVDARDVCHPEVAVVIGASTFSVRQAVRGVRFRNSTETSKVEMSSLDTAV